MKINALVITLSFISLPLSTQVKAELTGKQENKTPQSNNTSVANTENSKKAKYEPIIHKTDKAPQDIEKPTPVLNKIIKAINPELAQEAKECAKIAGLYLLIPTAWAVVKTVIEKNQHQSSPYALCFLHNMKNNIVYKALRAASITTASRLGSWPKLNASQLQKPFLGNFFMRCIGASIAGHTAKNIQSHYTKNIFDNSQKPITHRDKEKCNSAINEGQTIASDVYFAGLLGWILYERFLMNKAIQQKHVEIVAKPENKKTISHTPQAEKPNTPAQKKHSKI